MKRAFIRKTSIASLVIAMLISAFSGIALLNQSVNADEITEGLVEAVNATVIAEEDGYLVDSTAGTAYSGEIPYALQGDSKITFSFPHSRGRGWIADDYALNFVYDVCDLNGNVVFQVFYKSTHDQTIAYVKYGVEIRTFTYFVNTDPWYQESGIYMYKEPGYAYGYFAPTMFGDEIGDCVMEIKMVEDVVQVWATYNMGKNEWVELKQVMIAAFDGSNVGFSKPESGLSWSSDSAWGLPKVHDQLKDGYKIKFSCENKSNKGHEEDIDLKIKSVVGKVVEAETSELITLTENLLEAENATVTAEEDGYFLDSTAGVAYSGKIPYVLQGNSKVTFSYPNDRNKGWAADDYGLDFVYDVCDLNGNVVFQVVYKSNHDSTIAFVKYGNEYRTFTYHVNTDPWHNANGFYLYQEKSFGYGYFAPTTFSEYGDGVMEIRMVDDVVQVWATYNWGKGDWIETFQVMIAAFDGSDVGFTMPEKAFVAATESPKWGLPKVYNQLKDGYTINFSCSNVSNKNDQVDVDLKIKSVEASNVLEEEVKEPESLTENLLTATNATVTAEEDGYFLDSTAGTAYSGEIPYVLQGNSKITFAYPNNRTKGWAADDYGLNFVYDVCDLNGDVVFQVIYKTTHESTIAYVKYGNELRTFTYHVNTDPWHNANGFYMYQDKSFGYGYFAPTMFGEFGDGVMEIKIVEDVVQIWATYNWGKSDWIEPLHVMIAAFDGSDVGFVKPEAAFVAVNESPKWGLPKVYDRLKDGYKIKFSCSNVSNKGDQVDVDLKIKSVVANSAVLDDRKEIEIHTTESFENCGIGFELVIPDASWTSKSSLTPTAITSAMLITPSGEVEVAVGEAYAIQEAGVHKIVYSVDGSSKYIEFTAQEATIATLDRLQVTGATAEFINTEKDKGILLASSTPYSAELNGVFFGSTSIDFRFTETNTDYIGGYFVIRVTDALDPSISFQVEYSIVCEWDADGYTGAHVKYGDSYRSSRYWGTEWYNSRVTGDETAYCGPSLLNDRGDRDGTLSLEFDANGVLYVKVSSFREDPMRVIAAFDGTENFVSGTSWGLPKLSFENGYKISLESSFSNEATQDKATDVCIKAITTGGSTLTFDKKYLAAEYAFRVEFKDVASEGETIFVPCGENVGKVNGLYSIVFNGAEWVQAVVPVTVNVDTSTVGTKIIEISDDSFEAEWKVASRAYTMVVEETYTLAFDTNGGTAIAPIVYSEHTKERVVLGTTERIGMQFDGWYIGEEKFSGNLAELYGMNVTLTASWLDVTPPVISLANGVKDVVEALKDRVAVVSLADVKAEDAAQNDTVTVVIEVKAPSGEFVSVADGYSLTLSEAGTYTIRYTATDGAGLTAEITREILVIERSMPTITVVEEGKSEACVGEKVVLSTVVAKDADNKELSVSLTVTANGEVVELQDGALIPEAEGEYTVIYTTKDSWELVSMHTYTITVGLDTIAPEISVLLADQEVELDSTVILPEASVSDNVEDGITTEVTVKFSSDKVELVNGAFVADREGVYTITYTATDKAGNKTEKVVYITSRDSELEPVSKGCGSSIGGAFMLPLAFAAVVALFAKKREN